jgi:hypothetical protein
MRWSGFVSGGWGRVRRSRVVRGLMQRAFAGELVAMDKTSITG